MSHRERMLAALRREGSDHLPWAIHFAAAKLEEFRARTDTLDPSEYFQLDYRHISPAPPRSVPDFSRYFEGRVPDWPHQDANGFSLTPFRGDPAYFVVGDHNTALNEWGEYRIYDADRDYHRKMYPLDRPDCTLDDIEVFPLPNLFAEQRYDGIVEAVQAIHQRGLAAVLPWEMTIFEKAWRIRGLEPLMMDLALRPELADCLLNRIAERTGYLAARYAEAGVDVIQLGDDVGSQHGMMISPGHWRHFLKSRMARIIRNIKEANAQTLVFYHSDGNIEAIIPDLIEIGVDILNPVQPECMDTARLKRQFGNRLSFWGGIGVQTTLPFGSPEAVQTAITQLVEDAGRGGGLLIAPAHLIERDVPWANVEAFVSAARRFCGQRQ